MASVATPSHAADRVCMCEGIDHPIAMGLACEGCPPVGSTCLARTYWACTCRATHAADIIEGALWLSSTS
eukprot:6452692-Pyramimonas_sp.AAC.1